ncbi:hypothetical protein POTOM_020744 [Populus tomentosa]|uniref:Cytochrome P450 n=1 Tax=Populus tomentosa TaxID=118781 RepID=A0A8X8CRW2_POPTO|nr:hypothetical protein POTOM_020744 [Populus tomentosa]
MVGFSFEGRLKAKGSIHIEWYGSIFRTSLVGHQLVISTDSEFNRFIFQREGKLFQCCYSESFGEILGSENMLFAEGSLQGYTIPAGWIVRVCPPAVHMNPKQYDDPFSFNPWRWQGQELNAGSQNFMSFGGGSRLCAGAEFSKLQMAIFLHHLITKYRWRVIRGGEISRLPAVIFPNGFHVQILEKNA